MKNKNPLQDIIDDIQRIEHESPAEIDKRNHQVSGKLAEATGRLIQTVLDLDRQNKKLEKTNLGLQKAAISLGVIAILFTIYQVTNNLGYSLIITLIIELFIYFWIIKN